MAAARHRLLLMLANAAPRCVARGVLRDELWPGPDAPADEDLALRGLVHRIRERHGADVIRTHEGAGYSMDPAFAREVLEVGAEPVLAIATRRF